MIKKDHTELPDPGHLDAGLSLPSTVFMELDEQALAAAYEALKPDALTVEQNLAGIDQARQQLPKRAGRLGSWLVNRRD
jgi:hypothetical protein